MVIKVNTPLKTLGGEVMQDNDGKGNVMDATLKTVIVNALLSPVERESGVEKMKKYELATRIYKSEDEVELSAEEITLIKARVGELFAPLVVGQVYNALEGK